MCPSFACIFANEKVLCCLVDQIDPRIYNTDKETAQVSDFDLECLLIFIQLQFIN